MKKLVILLLVLVVLISACDGGELPPLIDDGGNIINEKLAEEESVLSGSTCAEICEEKGYSTVDCVSESYEGEKLKCHETKVVGGVAANCNEDQDNTEITYLCCCGESEPERMSAIDVRMDVAPPGHGGQIINSIATIFVNHEKGEVVSSFVTFAESYVDEINGAIDAAKTINLTLEYETLEIIDGGEALVMRADVIEVTDELYILPLGDFLSDYDFKYSDFKFNSLDVKEWSAYKAVVTDNCEGNYEHCASLSEDVKVLEFKNAPGILTGKVSGYRSEESSFLSGSVLVTGEENSMGLMLDRSESFVDFLTNLVEAGYFLVAGDSGNYMLSG